MFKKCKKEENPKELPKLTPVAPESINTHPRPATCTGLLVARGQGSFWPDKLAAFFS